MHNNYYYLQQVSSALAPILIGRTVDSAFSQDKDELVVSFLSKTDLFFIRAILKNSFVCLTFPSEFHRARKNTVELFSKLTGRTVEKIIQYQNDRSFAIQLDSGLLLLFKLHGNRSNVLLYQDNKVIELFQNNIEADLSLSPESLHRDISPTFEDFIQNKQNPATVYPTLGKPVAAYLKQEKFPNKSAQEQWTILQQFIYNLENPSSFYVVRSPAHLSTGNSSFQLTLFPTGNTEFESSDPLEIANRFYSLYARESTFDREKQQVLHKLDKQKKQTESYLAKTYEKLNQIQTEARHEQLANILMANIHQIPSGSEAVELFDFYHNQTIRIKLKKEFSAQKNAETYYRKAKNEKIEIEILEKAITQKELEMAQIKKYMADISAIQNLKVLRNYVKDHDLASASTIPTIQELFKRFEYQGFEILVGKNAKNNDLLTREYAWKEDLWLHAKDVTGSHVIIKYQSGKKFPEPVIEKAAQLAAYYSKRKNDTLCPVTVTPRKYIRKPKGLPEGAVIIDKEQVVLVEPADFSGL
ncbi:NFACT RNA binding domain-containing protein [Xanthocytophaga agilis]|uniref:NFACT RNA binding domain-containing protein n=1 Tax=Xanthocytophaga agilis TaxID=3048010 RepID=A0AAE3R705_9BACT|nr:NFACT RNA binding domain-containing protein [Xanthocytophaga agilis]MDJ1501862.1 NFACT RNA binding domain-containing protein [Xanthocytophaga agilis]